MKKRLLSFMISLILILSLIPMTAFAKDSGSRSVTSPGGYTISASCGKHGVIKLEKSGEKVLITVSPEEGYIVDYVSARTVLADGEEGETVKLTVTKTSSTDYILKLSAVDEEGRDASIYAGIVSESGQEDAEEVLEDQDSDEAEAPAEVVEETTGEQVDKETASVDEDKVVDEAIVNDKETDKTVDDQNSEASISDDVESEDETSLKEDMDDEETEEEELELTAMGLLDEEASEDEMIDPLEAGDAIELAAGATITSTDISWVKDSGKTLVVTGSGKSSSLSSVKIDGSTVDASNYTKTGSSSTTVTFTAAYMNSLSTGVHSISFGYKSGDTPSVNMLIKQSPASTITNVGTTNTNNSGYTGTTPKPTGTTTTGSNGSSQTYLNRVQTGDTSQMGVWITMIIIAAFAIASVPSTADKKLY